MLEIAYGKTLEQILTGPFVIKESTYGSCPVPTAFRLQIFVNTPITTSANLVTTASVYQLVQILNLEKPPQFHTPPQLQAKLHSLKQAKVISGCKNIAVITTASCSWKPSKRNAQIVSARLSPTNGSLSSHTASTNVFILKRTTSR
jgi:hypothetical protein